MTLPAYEMDVVRRNAAVRTLMEVCTHRGWSLLAAHVRSNHVHVVVHAEAVAERIMNDFKVYISRAFNVAGLDGTACKRWARHGSTRYLWKAEQVEAAIHYVVHEQGEPMAVFENKERALKNAP